MFGFSLQKILVLAAVVGAVWYGFKLITRLQEARDLKVRAQGDGAGRAGAGRPAKGSGEAAFQHEDLVQCPVCATYVAARGAGSCDRLDCPY